MTMTNPFKQLLTHMIKPRYPLRYGFVSCYRLTYACRLDLIDNKVTLRIRIAYKHTDVGQNSTLIMMYCIIKQSINEYKNKYNND